MNSKNSKNSDLDRLILTLSDKNNQNGVINKLHFQTLGSTIKATSFKYLRYLAND